jgi:hypothetical protein
VLGSVSQFFLLPAYDLHSGVGGLLGSGWRPFIPVEEILFYFLGFTAVLLSYIWCDEVLFSDSRVDDAVRTRSPFSRWWSTFVFWVLICLFLFAIAYVIRAHTLSPGERGFPGYFLFLLVGSILPSMLCSRLALHFLNFRALTLSWLLVLAISQFWEAGLAVPYGWWGYRNDQMIGLFIKPACDLPVEAVLVWSLASWTAVVVYETILNVFRIRQQNPNRRLLAALGGEASDVQPLKRYYRTERTQ